MSYNAFVEVTKEAAIQLAFVSKALGDDPGNKQYHNILIEPTETEKELRAIATDGRRMHIVDPLFEYPGIKEGHWRFLQFIPESKTLWMARISNPYYPFVD